MNTGTQRNGDGVTQMNTGTSVGNSHRSASLRPITLTEDRKLFVDFSSILCL